MSGREAGRRPGARTTIAVQGARVHNLKNISVEIPRDSLVVVTGLSGSGKSSLAFDTIYAEGQRRYMESLSSFAKRFVAQVAKPDVDFVFGLSPVISIEQKTLTSNPRSTVGTMTDIASYLNLLFATIGQAHCPRTGEPTPSRTSSQILEAILSLPEGTEVELRAPVFKVYGEDLDFVFTEVRKKGCRRVIVDGKAIDSRDRGRARRVGRAAHGRRGRSLRREPPPREGDQGRHRRTLLVGDGLAAGARRQRCARAEAERFYREVCSATHHFVYGDIGPEFFVFNNPESACRTCGGLGVDKLTHPELLIPDPKRSIRGGLLRARGIQVQPGHLGRPHDVQPVEGAGFLARHAVEGPARKGAPGDPLRHRAAGRSVLISPPDAKVKRGDQEGREVGFGGIARRIERYYRRYRQRGEASSRMEAWLDKVMVEHTCPDCNGRARPRRRGCSSRSAARRIHDVGQLNFDELHAFLGTIKPTGRGADAGRQVLKEIRGRLELLLGIGLDYLNFNRRSGTLSGGESQRIRLSTQIGSGLMGMLYVLDEPSIGLHPKDNVKMIATLESLRDIGNTVIVVEHDEDTIRAADHVVEMGPGPGRARRPGRRPGDARRCPEVQGVADRTVPLRRALDSRRRRTARRATARRSSCAARARTTSRSIDVTFPLGQLVAITGASGSGKSTLVNEILYKALWKRLVDTRTLPGEHDARRRRRARAQGRQHRPVADRPEQPLESGHLRRLLRHHPRSLHAARRSPSSAATSRGDSASTSRAGAARSARARARITTQLYFMPDVEVTCGACKGARFNSETLEVTLRGKTIDDVLNMSVEEGVAFFASEPAVARRSRCSTTSASAT